MQGSHSVNIDSCDVLRVDLGNLHGGERMESKTNWWLFCERWRYDVYEWLDFACIVESRMIGIIDCFLVFHCHHMLGEIRERHIFCQSVSNDFDLINGLLKSRLLHGIALLSVVNDTWQGQKNKRCQSQSLCHRISDQSGMEFGRTSGDLGRNHTKFETIVLLTVVFLRAFTCQTNIINQWIALISVSICVIRAIVTK